MGIKKRLAARRTGRQHNNIERAFRFLKLFESKSGVTTEDIALELECSYPCALRYLREGSRYLQIYQINETKPYRFGLLR
jgi:hypothetical protein